MDNPTRSDTIDQLVGSYFELPVAIFWERAEGLPFPNTFSRARLELQGIATNWMNLEQVVWRAQEVKFIPGLPAEIQLASPSIEVALGQAEFDRWISRFELPYRLELGKNGLILHTEIAGFPVAEFETRLEVVDGWFVLQPKRASFLGVPGYVSSLFRSYLPLPPLTRESRLDQIEHEAGRIRLRFALEDFTEEITPGMLSRLKDRLLPPMMERWINPPRSP